MSNKPTVRIYVVKDAREDFFVGLPGKVPALMGQEGLTWREGEVTIHKYVPLTAEEIAEISQREDMGNYLDAFLNKCERLYFQRAEAGQVILEGRSFSRGDVICLEKEVKS